MKPRILIAVDLGTASDLLIDTGFSLAQTLHAEPYLLYTYAFPPPSPTSFYPEASRAIYEQAKLDLRRLVRDKVPAPRDEQLLARSGPAARLIVDAARELGVELIVMGTHRMRGIERLVVGSTAESVTRRAACPVLVVPCPTPNSRETVADLS
ncbi:MAG TPA: universal stress protein [Polyangiales bacterium]